MITYMTIQFDSEGGKPSDIISALEDIGFKPATGFYDLQYDWNGDADIDEVLCLADKIAATLSGMKVSFKLETAREES
jgi:hypothetical protein